MPLTSIANITLKSITSQHTATVHSSKSVLSQNPSLSLSFSSHLLSLNEADQLNINDTIDFRDDNGKFIFATISNKKESYLNIDYNDNDNTWCDYKKELHRFAKPQSISSRSSHRFNNLKINDFIDINPSFQIPIYQCNAWKYAQIIEFDDNSGQIKVRLFYDDKCIYWTHLDNTSEVALFRSKPRCKINIPFPQTLKRSKQIVNQFVIESEKLLKFHQNSFNQIPSEISEEITAFYHHSISLPIFTNYAIGDVIQNIMDHTLYKVVAKNKRKIVVEATNNYKQYELDVIDDNKKFKKCLNDQRMIDMELIRLDWTMCDVSDGDGIYGCFAKEIYDDMSKSDMVKRQCDRYISDNNGYFERLKEWKMVIIAMCELYNVRIRIFEYDEMHKELFMSYEYGVGDETDNLPMIMLLEENEYYHVISSPNLRYQRPLNGYNNIGAGKERRSMLEFRELSE